MAKLFSKVTCWVFEGGYNLNSDTIYEIAQGSYAGLKVKVSDVNMRGQAEVLVLSLGITIDVEPDSLLSPSELEAKF